MGQQVLQYQQNKNEQPVTSQYYRKGQKCEHCISF